MELTKPYTDKVSEIIKTFVDCQSCSDSQIYFPIDKIGRIINLSLDLRRELNDAYFKIERLQKELEQFNKES